MSETKDDIKLEICKILCSLLKERDISVYKIVFFGSFARGDLKDDSDIDVMIISKNFRDKTIFERVEMTLGIGREIVRRFKKPFDIMYYSDEEWNEGNSLIINSAKEEGEVIYE